MRNRKHSNRVHTNYKGIFKLKRIIALVLTVLMVYSSLPPLSVYAQNDMTSQVVESSGFEQNLWSSPESLQIPAAPPAADPSALLADSTPTMELTQDVPSLQNEAEIPDPSTPPAASDPRPSDEPTPATPPPEIYLRTATLTRQILP